MATIYQRVQFFHSTSDYRFGKKRLKHVAALVKRHYDGKGDKLPPVKFIESIEERGTFIVRDYPNSHTPFIDKIITKVYEKIQSNIKVHKQKTPVKKDSKQRTRKPIQKPVYSSKSTTRK